ncbi:MAG: hypothetical protein M1821_001123 [Bathelium mastoideum]|nr:MAG: hypothetical protein M1821_001123 [Bathelium mastoideum]
MTGTEDNVSDAEREASESSVASGQDGDEDTENSIENDIEDGKTDDGDAMQDAEEDQNGNASEGDSEDDLEDPALNLTVMLEDIRNRTSQRLARLRAARGPHIITQDTPNRQEAMRLVGTLERLNRMATEQLNRLTVMSEVTGLPAEMLAPGDSISIITNAILELTQVQRSSNVEEQLLRPQDTNRIFHRHLHQLELQSTHRSDTRFANPVDPTTSYTADVLRDSLPGLASAIERRFSQSAVHIPLAVDSLDGLAGGYGPVIENFSWEEAIEEAIEDMGQESVQEWLFDMNSEETGIDGGASSRSDRPSHQNRPNCSSTQRASTSHSRRRAPTSRSSMQDFDNLRRIEANNFRHGVSVHRPSMFQNEFDTNQALPATALARSFPGLDDAIRHVFGGGNTSRPINIEYLDRLADSILELGDDEGNNAADPQAWIDVLRYEIEEIGKEDVNDELFVDWVDELPDNLRPLERQMLHLMYSDNRGTSESTIALFKSMYAASRENRRRCEVQQASEELRAILQRQGAFNRPNPPPPIMYPQSLQLYEDANEAHRMEIEAEDAAHRERHRLPPRCCDCEYDDEMPDAIAVAEYRRGRRIEEIRQQPPEQRSINTWFLLMTECLSRTDPDEDEWHWWATVQERLRRLPPDVVHRIAYLNTVQGIGVEHLLSREERRQRSWINNRPSEESADGGAGQRGTLDIISEYRLEFVSQQQQVRNLYAIFLATLDRMPQLIRARLDRQQVPWAMARGATWRSGEGCGETPAQNMVRESYEADNRARAQRGEGPSPVMNMELEVARRFDDFSHQRGHLQETHNLLQHLERIQQERPPEVE